MNFFLNSLWSRSTYSYRAIIQINGICWLCLNIENISLAFGLLMIPKFCKANKLQITQPLWKIQFQIFPLLLLHIRWVMENHFRIDFEKPQSFINTLYSLIHYSMWSSNKYQLNSQWIEIMFALTQCDVSIFNPNKFHNVKNERVKREKSSCR